MKPGAAEFVVIASTAGSVLGRLLRVDYFRRRIRCVASDRQCGAVEVATAHGVPVKLYETRSGAVFSDFLLEEFRADPPDLFVSFYTRLFKGEFVRFAKNKLVNSHPSILPACPGRDGFGDTIKFGSRFIGATIHLVDEGMDTGFPLIQSALPLDPGMSLERSRHQVFVQQCKMLLQVIRWIEQGRIRFGESGAPIVADARYQVSEFSPNLDFDVARNFRAGFGGA